MRKTRYIFLILFVAVCNVLLALDERPNEIAVSCSNEEPAVVMVGCCDDADEISIAHQANSLFQVPRVVDSAPSIRVVSSPSNVFALLSHQAERESRCELLLLALVGEDCNACLGELHILNHNLRL